MSQAPESGAQELQHLCSCIHPWLRPGADIHSQIPVALFAFLPTGSEGSGGLRAEAPETGGNRDGKRDLSEHGWNTDNTSKLCL